MNTATAQRAAAASMTGAALLAIAGFTALGSIFDYPDILKEPTAAILALYRENSTAVSAWFLVLVVGAALLAPAGIFLGRLTGGPPPGRRSRRTPASCGRAPPAGARPARWSRDGCPGPK